MYKSAYLLLAILMIGCTLSGFSTPGPETITPDSGALSELTDAGSTLPAHTSQPTIVAQTTPKNMEALFRLAQQKAQTDPNLRYVIEHYGPGCEGICVLSVSGGAQGIVDVGEDYVCLNDVLFDNQPPSSDVCLPYSSIVRVRFTNTMFP